MSNPKQPTRITDKNGKETTVHRNVNGSKPGKARAVPAPRNGAHIEAVDHRDAMKKATTKRLLANHKVRFEQKPREFTPVGDWVEDMKRADASGSMGVPVEVAAEVFNTVVNSDIGVTFDGGEVATPAAAVKPPLSMIEAMNVLLGSYNKKLVTAINEATEDDVVTSAAIYLAITEGESAASKRAAVDAIVPGSSKFLDFFIAD